MSDDDLKAIQDFFLAQVDNFPRLMNEHQACYFLFLFGKAYQLDPAQFAAIALQAAVALNEIPNPTSH